MRGSTIPWVREIGSVYNHYRKHMRRGRFNVGEGNKAFNRRLVACCTFSHTFSRQFSSIKICNSWMWVKNRMYSIYILSLTLCQWPQTQNMCMKMDYWKTQRYIASHYKSEYECRSKDTWSTNWQYHIKKYICVKILREARIMSWNLNIDKMSKKKC